MQVPRFPQMNRKIHSLGTFLPEVPEDARILNAGSARARFRKAVNVDIRANQDVDVLADLHAIPFQDDAFDLVVCTGTLQYCEDPRRVVGELRRCLRPGGWAYIDVPFMQPYCPGLDDLWRFSLDGLRVLFRGWTIVRSGSSIPYGPAAAFHAQMAARFLRLHRVPKYVLTWAVSLAWWPLTWVRFDIPETAGALYLIAQKPAE